MIIHGHRQRNSSARNRKRETCTSGSVRGEGGNILTYSAARRSERRVKANPPYAPPHMGRKCQGDNRVIDSAARRQNSHVANGSLTKPLHDGHEGFCRSRRSFHGAGWVHISSADSFRSQQPLAPCSLE